MCLSAVLMASVRNCSIDEKESIAERKEGITRGMEGGRVRESKYGNSSNFTNEVTQK